MARKTPAKFRGTVTLCWVCQNCFGDCSWSRDYTPVEGWKAKSTTVQRQPREGTASYLVLSCPEFIPEEHLCSRCASKPTCTFSPFRAGRSEFVADCDKFTPLNPEYPNLSRSALDEAEKRGEIQRHRGGKQKRAVEQWTKDRSTYIKDFESLSAAAREVGGTNTHIARVCNGEWKSAKGFWWRWIYAE